MTGQPHPRVCLTDEPGVYRLGATARPDATPWIDARDMTRPPMVSACYWDDCDACHGSWQRPFEVRPLRRRADSDMSRGTLLRGHKHTVMAQRTLYPHAGGVWLLRPIVDDLSRISRGDVPVPLRDEP